MKLTSKQLQNLIKEELGQQIAEPTEGYFDALKKLESAYNAVSDIDIKNLGFRQQQELRGWAQHILDSI